MEERRVFGNTGLKVSPLGFGGAPIGYLATEQAQVARILNLLLDAGVNVVDTADCYEQSESVIGRAVGYRRADYVLVSKCGHQGEELSGAEWSAELITQTVDRSLKRLRTDVLDVMLLHSCTLEVLQQGESIGALVRARAAGKIRFLGYSGDNEAAVYAAGLAEVDVLEMSINICDQANLETALPVARERNLGVLVKRSIANAAWKASQPGLYASYAQPYVERLRAMRITPQDLGFEGAPEAIWPEIALRFTLAQPGAHTAIIGTTNPNNAHANLQFAAQGPLPATAASRLREAFTTASAQAAKPWRGLT